MWIYVVYSQGPETLHNGTPKMYVTFFPPGGGKTVVIIHTYYCISMVSHHLGGRDDPLPIFVLPTAGLFREG